MIKKSKHSKNNSINNPEDFKKVENKKKNKAKIIILIIIIVTILILSIKSAISINNWKTIIQDMTINQNSVIIDTNGNIIAEIGGEKTKEKIDFNEIPSNLKNAYIAIEDKRFYKHKGVDIKRTGAAVISYVTHRGSSFGGSSITQQLVKNLTGDSSNSISRKVKEWGEATVLETFMSKDEILNLYLNIIYVGPNIYGVESGSKYYFNKSASDLTLEECAFLAGINNSPNSYNPFGENDNSEKIKSRTKTVLKQMLDLEYINQDDYNEAINKVDLGLKFNKRTIKTNDNIYSYHTDALISDLIEDISDKKNISETFASNYISMSGFTIYSTQNTEIQNQIEKEFEKSKYQLPSNNGGEPSQAAMVIIDHSTGQITGCVGGLGKKTVARGLNRATQSIRQTGSAIKPIAVLVPGISEKIFTGATIFNDEQKEFEDGYKPENYSNYLGDITVRRALESSQNIPFVEMMQKITPKKSIKYLKKMGITTLSKEDENLALALGGLDKGISPLQMASAYATIANDGVYIEPTFYTKVVNEKSEVIIESKQKTRKVFSKEVAYIIKELLTEPVTQSGGTATYCAISGIDVAAKTGTTDENYDRWLCGFTPYYTAVTWYGYDQNETISYNGKKNPAGILWANIMAKIHSNLEKVTFNKPASVISTTICSDTGMKANSSCTNTYTEYFLFGTIPDTCTKHYGSSTNNKNTTKTNTTTKQNKTTDSFDMTTKEDLDAQTVEKDNIKNESSKNTTVNNTVQDTNSKKENNVSNNTSANTKNTNSNEINNITNSTSNTKNNNNVNSSSNNVKKNTVYNSTDNNLYMNFY